MSALLDSVCRAHAITRKQFKTQTSLLVREAQADFICQAYEKYRWDPDEIARVLKWPRKNVDYHIKQIIGQRNSDVSPVRTDMAAGPLLSFEEQLHNGSAASQYTAATPYGGKPSRRAGQEVVASLVPPGIPKRAPSCRILWAMPEGVEMPA